MFDYILSLGGTVFVPMVMILIGLIFRIPVLQAVKAGGNGRYWFRWYGVSHCYGNR